MPSWAAPAAAASGSTAPVLETPSERRITIFDFGFASLSLRSAVARPSPMAVICSSRAMARPCASTAMDGISTPLRTLRSASWSAVSGERVAA